MTDFSLPPFVATLGGQQPASFIQAAFLVGSDIKAFQVPLASLSEKDLTVCAEKLKAEVLKLLPAPTPALPTGS